MIIKNERKHYASDLTDSQWAIIAPLFPPAGHKSKWEKRELVDAVLYLVENGCKWRNLPHDFPPPRYPIFIMQLSKAGYGRSSWQYWLLRQENKRKRKRSQPMVSLIPKVSKQLVRHRSVELMVGKNERAKKTHCN